MCEKGASCQEMFEKFPSRSHESILAKRRNEMSKSAASRGKDNLYRVGRNKLWTAEESALLFDLAQQGLSKLEVAAKLGRSINSVDGRFRRRSGSGMKIWPAVNEWNPQDAELMRLRKDGYSIEEIAKILHRSRHSIVKRWSDITPRSADGRPLACPSPVVKLSDTDFSHILHMRQSGNSWSAVQESRWPDRMDTQVRKAFSEVCAQRIADAESRAPPIHRRFTHKFSEDDLAQIRRLRKEGDTWPIIFTIMNDKSTLEKFKGAAYFNLRKTKVA
jgi:DNA-binding CsgD family transcriptional regulator